MLYVNVGKGMLDLAVTLVPKIILETRMCPVANVVLAVAIITLTLHALEIVIKRQENAFNVYSTPKDLLVNSAKPVFLVTPSTKCAEVCFFFN